MNKFIKSLVFALMMICASTVALAVPPAATIQKAKNVAESAQYQLPMQVYQGLMVTQIKYDSSSYSLVYRYQFTVQIPQPSTDAINEAKLAMIHLVKANPNSEDAQLIKNGITFQYNYYNADGSYIYTIKIRPSDIK